MSDMRRAFVMVVLALLPLSPAAAGPRLSLEAGGDVFWSGPYIESSDQGGSCGGSPCWDYQLRLLDTGKRLRIGLDHPQVDDAFDVEVFSPGGDRAGSFSVPTGLYSGESFHTDPEPGVWRVRVIAAEVTQSAFRMRAKLEKRLPPLVPKNGRVLPNLQVLPPHDATFLFPVTNGSMGDPPQGTDLMGTESCHPEERIEDRAVRCLRFSFGIRNTGRGPMQLFYNGAIPQDHDLFQRVRRPDETFFDRRAGMARWHKTHGHYHHHDAVALQLFEVIDRAKGKVDARGAKHRKGFAHRDELIRDWRNFYPTWPRFGFGLSAGWSDIYEWDRPGNYIDFGLNDDGYYVVRMWADPTNGILESNEKDNAGYSYLRVTGREVKLLEVGRGRDPWDRCKIVVGPGGNPDPRPRPRPASCPPDTT